MAQTQQLGDLLTRFYDRFDEGSSQYIGTTQATRLINEGGRHLHNWIISVSEDYIVNITTIAITQYQIDYALPNDFFKDIKVFGTYTTAVGTTSVPYYWPMRRVMKNEYRGGPATAFRLPYYIPFGYMIFGQTFRITPMPDIVNNFGVQLWYAPHYTELVNVTDTMAISVIPGWDEFVINHAVIGAKIKEGVGTVELQARQAEVKQFINEQLINRDLGMPQRVTDINAFAGQDMTGNAFGGFY